MGWVLNSVLLSWKQTSLIGFLCIADVLGFHFFLEQAFGCSNFSYLLWQAGALSFLGECMEEVGPEDNQQHPRSIKTNISSRFKEDCRFMSWDDHPPKHTEIWANFISRISCNGRWPPVAGGRCCEIGSWAARHWGLWAEGIFLSHFSSIFSVRDRSHDSAAIWLVTTSHLPGKREE